METWNIDRSAHTNCLDISIVKERRRPREAPSEGALYARAARRQHAGGTFYSMPKPGRWNRDFRTLSAQPFPMEADMIAHERGDEIVAMIVARL